MLVNERSGFVRRSKLTAADIYGFVGAVGLEAEVKMVRSSALRFEAAEALRRGADVIAAGGGDGTINTVASCLFGTSAALAVLPLGTFNHFAKDLGIPLDLESALRNIVTGKRHRIDLGQVNDHIFVNNSSIGLYPHIVKRREGLRKKLQIDKFTAMVYATATIFRRFPVFKIKLSVDDREYEFDTPFVFVGNNEYSMDLFNLGTRERLDGGQLCLYTTNCTGRLCLLRLALRLFFNKLEQSTHFSSKLVKELTLSSKRKKLRVSLDGEVARLVPPLRYRILPAALDVIVPVGKDDG